MPPLPAALIFDCDGTLALTGDLHFAAFVRAVATQGGVLDRAFYDARAGLARHGFIAEWLAATGSPADPLQLAQDSITEAARLARAGHGRPNPPVAALVRAWGAQRPSAVASNGEGPVVRATLEACGLLPLFDTVVTLDEVAMPKPDPEMFLLAARRLGHLPADCLVLEDSAQGMEAARRAGIPALDVRRPEALAQIAAMIPALQAPAA